MAKYVVQAALPTVYVIDAKSEQDAMQQASERFKKEHNTWIEPDVQWAPLQGSDTASEWIIADWGGLQ